MYRAIKSFTDIKTNRYYVPGDIVKGTVAWLEQLRKMGLVEKVKKNKTQEG